MGQAFTSPPATYDDLRAVPAHLVAEIIGGRLVTHPRPRPRHARASSMLGAKLVPPFDAVPLPLGALWAE